jgi:hypothetical protein
MLLFLRLSLVIYLSMPCTYPRQGAIRKCKLLVEFDVPNNSITIGVTPPKYNIKT